VLISATKETGGTQPSRQIYPELGYEIEGDGARMGDTHGDGELGEIPDAPLFEPPFTIFTPGIRLLEC
jgi:hypothetical protein